MMPFNETDQDEMGKFCLNTRNVVYMGLLIALNVVFTRVLGLSVWNLKIGFGFVPIVLAAVMFGPVPAALVAGFGDLIGTLMFPVGPYFPGFTLTAVLTAFVYGVFLYRKHSFGRICLAVAVNQIVLSLLLNTYWISFLYVSPFKVIFATRIVQTAILIPVQIIVISAILKSYSHVIARKAIA